MRNKVARIENTVTGTINHAYKCVQCVGGMWVGGVGCVYSVSGGVP